MIKSAAIALALLGVATGAHAGQSTRTVAYSDLDLATPAGAAELDRRVARAARKVCGPEARDLAGQADFARCRVAAMASARNRVATAKTNAQVRLAAR